MKDGACAGWRNEHSHCACRMSRCCSAGVQCRHPACSKSNVSALASSDQLGAHTKADERSHQRNEWLH